MIQQQALTRSELPALEMIFSTFHELKHKDFLYDSKMQEFPFLVQELIEFLENSIFLSNQRRILDLDYINSIFLLRQKQIKYLENIYNFENPEKVRQFLLSNLDLVQVLLEAPEHIFSVLGRVPMFLELHHDPEENWDELFIIIKFPGSAKEIIELEEKLFEIWFDKIIEKVGNRLNFSIEPDEF